MAQPISLDSTYNTPGISLDNADTHPIPSPEVAQQTAAKAEFGLDVPYVDAFNSIASGNEVTFRQGQAAAKDQQNMTDRQNYILNTIRQVPDAGILARDKYWLSQFTGTPTPTDPKSVIEDYYSGAYLKPWYNQTEDFLKGTFLGDGLNRYPDDTKTELDYATPMLTYRQYALKKAQDALEQTKVSSPTFWTHTLTHALLKAVVPFMDYDTLKNFRLPEEFLLRNLTGEGYDLGSAGLGSAMENEAQTLRSLPYPEFKTRLDSINSYLNNIDPNLAAKFNFAVYGQSLSQIRDENIQTWTQVPQDFAMMIGGMRQVRDIVRQLTIRQTQTAIVQAIETAAAADAGADARVTQQAGIGNLKEAAIEQEARNDANNTPADVKAFNRLPTLFRTIGQEIRNDPGNHGQEFANRLADRADVLGDTMEKAKQTVAQVNRIPVIELSRDMQRMAAAEAVEQYSDPNSKVFNAGNPIHSSKLDGDVVQGAGGSNTYWIPIRAGDENGFLLKSEDQALEAAELSGKNIHEPRTTNRAYADDRVQESLFNIHNLEESIKDLGNPQELDGPGLNRYNKLTDDLNKARSDLQDLRKVRAAAYLVSDAERPSVDGWMLKQWGAGFYWERYVPMPENGVVYQKLIKLNPEAQTPMSKKQTVEDIAPMDSGGQGQHVSGWSQWATFIDNPGYLKQLVAGIRSPEESMSFSQRGQRGIAVHAAKALLNTIKANDKIVKSVPRKYVNRFREVLKFSQQAPDENGEPGMFFKSPGELDQHYINNYGETASPKETEAYFAHVLNQEFDRGLRTWGMARNMWINGVEAHTISRRTEAGNIVKSVPIHGTLQKTLPAGDHSVYINWDRKPITTGSKLGTKNWKDIQELVQKGEMQVVKIWNTEDRDWHSFDPRIGSGAKIEYVVSPSVSTRNIDVANLIPRRGGGHWIFEYPYYGKQAKIVKDEETGLHHYEGDQTAMAFATSRTGRRWTDHMNRINEYMKTNDFDGARAFHGGSFGMNFDDHILPNYQSKKGPDGRMLPPRFNPHEPWYLVPKGGTIAGMDKGLSRRYFLNGKDMFRDGTRSGNPARLSQIEFTGERDAYDLHTIQDKGTPRNPIYTYRPADLMSPIDSSNRAISRIVNSSFMDDYKYMAVKHWIQAATPWLKEGEDKIRGQPFHFFLDHEWLPHTPKEVRAVLESNKVKIQQFIGGSKNTLDAAIQSVSERMNNIVYSTGAGKYIPLDKIPSHHNPIQAFRSLVVHAKLGWVSQLFMQAFNLFNVALLEPKYAAQATMAGLMHQYARLMPKHLSYLGQIMEKAGFNPGEYEEAWKGAMAHGFIQVQGEHPVLGGDVGMSWKSVMGAVGNTMMLPFYGGAAAARGAAWYTSYLKYVRTNPTLAGRLGREDWTKILAHARDLDFNMDRAANSSANTGLMSFPMMFYNYSRNASELFYGKRLTLGQKAALAIGTSLLWGIPGGGIGLLGFPFQEFSRQQAINHFNYLPGDNAMWSLAMEGMVSGLNAYMTGHGPLKDLKGRAESGTWYNYSKFGPGSGWAPLQALTGDRDIWSLLGAPYTAGMNTWKRTAPLYYWLAYQAGYGDPNQQFPLSPSDFTDLLREFQAFSMPERAYIAAKSGVWISNNGTRLQSGVTTTDAIWRALMGLTDARISDIQNTRAVIQDRGTFVHKIEQLYEKQVEQALTYAKQDNDSGPDSRYAKFMARGRFLLDLPDMPSDERQRIIERVMNNNRTLLENLEYQMTHKNVPENREEEMRQRRIRTRELEERQNP